ncbi:MAG: hydrogenase iron-sulfur subunit [Candidatus Altiarchaeota archaeon]|nr:hydrogenase iron-sulfur subunit [Candidatus Altiarchaeota archaeon]
MKESSVLVIGGGIAGMSASLDLADMGYKVYLVEKEPSIGGRMAQLDKTFPTLDCSICILAPKMVEVGRHPNIELLTYSEVEEVTGDVGNFRVKIRKKPRYVNDSCTGCGACTKACVLNNKIPDEFNCGLSNRGAAYITFPQAVPHKAVIDALNCLHLKLGKCTQKCMDACTANAIDFDQKEEILEVYVGSIVVATGFDLLDPSGIMRLGYGKYPDVITSLEFERLINASGPTKGELKKLSDGERPEKISFIQCVGSRDIRHKSYCSRVCCMYATKEAVLIKEHYPDVDVEVYFNDRRPMAKGHEEFFKRAEKEFGVRYINSLPSEVTESDGLSVVYEDVEGNTIKESRLDMVVLCPAIIPSGDTGKLAGVLDVGLDEHGFFRKHGSSNLDSSKKGIYLCGCSHGPEDIAVSVAEASGAAIKAAIDTKEGVKKEDKKPVEEKYVSPTDAPRIGVFICHCGINIGGVVDVKSVVEYTKDLPGVVYAGDNMYTCSEDAAEVIKDKISEFDLNRVIVAACTPRTHEVLFQNTLIGAGLNPYLFEMVNIRDQCSWPHMHEPVKATAKVKDLVAMAVSKTRLLEPQKRTEADVTKAALVIGAGVSGMTAALALADKDIKVYLIEKEGETGGLVKDMNYIEYKGETGEGLVTRLTDKVAGNESIELMLNTVVKRVDGSVGDYDVSLEGDKKVRAGAVIVATGAMEFKPVDKGVRVYTQLEFSKVLVEKNLDGEVIVMIQCMGARENKEGRTYCGVVCCDTAIKNALLIREKNRDARVYILYRDIVADEDSYRLAREAGVMFIKYDELPGLSNKGDKILVNLRAKDVGEDLELEADVVVYSTPPVPGMNKELSEILKVPLGQDGFFFEAHPKLRPLDFATDGIFVCGTAQGPKNVSESLNQAYGAASRAYTILSKDKVAGEAIVSVVNEDRCIGCGNCEAVCPYGAISIDVNERVAKTNPLLCKGCGTCAVECPAKAITMQHFTDEQLMAMIKELIANMPDDEPRILAFLCNWCSYAGADNAGVSRFQYPPNVRVIRVMCSGRVEPNYVYYALSEGVDGVLVAGCHKGDCHYMTGNLNAEKRMMNAKKLIEEAGYEPKRLRLEWVSASEGQRFADLIKEFTEELTELGLSPLKGHG